jgi:hypothetical protein
MQVKKRNLGGGTLTFPPIFRQNGEVLRAINPAPLPHGTQITASEGHPIDRKTGHRVGGGPFNSVLEERIFNPQTWNLNTGKGGFVYNGPVVTPFSTSAPIQKSEAELLKIQSDIISDMDADGATAISLVAPTNSVANLATSLAEAHREGLPSLPGIPFWKRRNEVAKAAGSEFLNAEFGWLPLVGEVRNVAGTAQHVQMLLKQHREDAGKSVRREFHYPDSRTISSSSVAGSLASVHNLNGTNVDFRDPTVSPVLTTTVETVVKRWFVGAFTYPPPPLDDKWDGLETFANNADFLFGTDITPDVLWELTPWSWAIDWFSNLGDVINNVTQFVTNGLVMRYGYMMTEKVTTYTYSLDKSGILGHPAPPAPSEIIIRSKNRKEANPFGFGIGWENLSVTQLAIAAALGITRFL